MVRTPFIAKEMSSSNASVDVEAFALEAILSVNKNEIVKLWREKLMVMYPTVEQHEMVPFHGLWVQNQFRNQD